MSTNITELYTLELIKSLIENKSTSYQHKTLDILNRTQIQMKEGSTH